MSDLHESASIGDLEGLEEGLKRGLDPSEPDPEWGGKTPLHIASARGHKKCVFVLIRAGSEVNARTDTGWTPAHSACETGQASCLHTLLSGGCDPSLVDHSGDTAARIAEIYGHEECIKVIREHAQKHKQMRKDKECSVPSSASN